MTSKESPLRGDIYWADLEPVKGSEQGGSRPVFVISNDLMNRTAPICMVIPITRPGEKAKEYPFNIKFTSDDWLITEEAITKIEELGHGFAGEGGFLLCNQARAFSKDRLLVKMGRFVTDDYIKRIEEAIIHSFGLDICDDCQSPLRPNGLICPNPNCKKKHRSKCYRCGTVNPLSFSFCPNCGRRV